MLPSYPPGALDEENLPPTVESNELKHISSKKNCLSLRNIYMLAFAVDMFFSHLHMLLLLAAGF